MKERIESVGQMKVVSVYSSPSFSVESKLSSKLFSSFRSFLVSFLSHDDQNRKLLNSNQRTTFNNKRLLLPENSSPCLTAGCAEQADLTKSVIDKVVASLKDDKTQKDILARAVAEIERE